MTAKQHGRIWKWIQNNLEIYRNLKGTIYTSPVQKRFFHACVLFETVNLRKPRQNKSHDTDPMVHYERKILNEVFPQNVLVKAGTGQYEHFKQGKITRDDLS